METIEKDMTPYKVTFRNFPPSEAVWFAVQDRIEKLERKFGRIERCDVVLARPHRHRHTHCKYNVHVRLMIPGNDVVVSRDKEGRKNHDDVYVAIRDSFDAVERHMKDRVNRMRGQVKAHESPSIGRVARLFTGAGYGFIATPSGREVYFNQNSLVNHDFGRVEVGAMVRFHEEMGQNGPQASSMYLTQ